MAHRNGEIPLADLTMTSIGVRLRADAAASVERMAPRFRREVGHALLASDGYRAKAGAFGQVAIFEDRYPSLTSLGIADRRGPWTRTSHPTLGARWWYRRKGAAAAAVPGTSNHGWATACDFASGINTAGTPAHRWMNEHGPEHGWIWPAWAQKQPTFEPWHREYHPDRDAHRVASDTTTSTGLTPGRPITPPTITLPEDTMSAETERKIAALYDAVFNGGESLPAGLPTPVRAEQIAEVAPDLAASAVWQTRVQRAGGEVSALQELADAKTAAQATLAELRDMRAKQGNEIWLAPVTGVDPVTGQTQVHPAAEWLAVMAFRVAAGVSPEVIVQAIPTEIAREVVDLLRQRLKD